MNETSGLVAEALNLVKEHYCFGNILSATEVHGGYVNKTFLVKVGNPDKSLNLIVRRYNPITANEKDVQFEHCVIKYLISNGLKIAPSVIENKYGTTYIKKSVVVNNKEEVRFWAVFEYLKGKVRYAFFDTNLTDGEMCSAASILARLHNAGKNFYQTHRIKRSQPKIMDYLPTFPKQYDEFAHNSVGNSFDTCFLEYRDKIFKKIDQISTPNEKFTQMPMVAIHGDYHQGNLTFEGSNVVGVFDFDWTRVDFRLFDLAQSIIYFCACWEGENAGSIDLENFSKFLKGYNDTDSSESTNDELTRIEIENIPLMLEIANQFVLFCIIAFYYFSEDVVEDEYLIALKHYINIMIWLEENRSILADVANGAC